MKRSIAHILGIIGAASVIIPMSVLKAEETISVQQYVDVLQGNTMFGVTESGQRWKFLLNSEGRVALKMQSGFQDEGIWEIKENKLCYEWGKIRKGKYYCTRDIIKDGDAYSSYNELDRKRSAFGHLSKGIVDGFRDVK